MAMKNPPLPGLSVKHDCLDSLGLTVTAAAKLLGVTRQTLSDLVSQTHAVKLLGVDQPKVSLIYRGRLCDMMLDELSAFRLPACSSVEGSGSRLVC